MSREVRKMWEYETRFIAAYQAYLKHCESLVKTGANRYAASHERDTAVHALKCVGELLTRAPHFNFSSNVLKLMCERSGTPITPLRGVACDALRRLFGGADPQGDLTLEGVTLLGKLMKENRLPNAHDVLGTFSDLKLSIHEDTHTEKPKNFTVKYKAKGRRCVSLCAKRLCVRVMVVRCTCIECAIHVLDASVPLGDTHWHHHQHPLPSCHIVYPCTLPTPPDTAIRTRAWTLEVEDHMHHTPTVTTTTTTTDWEALTLERACVRPRRAWMPNCTRTASAKLSKK